MDFTNDLFIFCLLYLIFLPSFLSWHLIDSLGLPVLCKDKHLGISNEEACGLSERQQKDAAHLYLVPPSINFVNKSAPWRVQSSMQATRIQSIDRRREEDTSRNGIVLSTRLLWHDLARYVPARFRQCQRVLTPSFYSFVDHEVWLRWKEAILFESWGKPSTLSDPKLWVLWAAF